MTNQPIYFAPLRVPVIDAKTGLMSEPWYKFFQALFLRSGGTSAPNNDDLAIGAPPSNTVPDSAALLAMLDPLGLLTNVAELREQIAVLTNEVQALKQGPVM